MVFISDNELWLLCLFLLSTFTNKKGVFSRVAGYILLPLALTHTSLTNQKVN